MTIVPMGVRCLDLVAVLPSLTFIRQVRYNATFQCSDLRWRAVLDAFYS